MKHFKFLSILSVFLLFISCGPSGVEIRGQFYTSGADVPNFMVSEEGAQYLMLCLRNNCELRCEINITGSTVKIQKT